ncbi:hypothetical protein OSTOST_11418 [Ostertagia ostertagi]
MDPVLIAAVERHGEAAGGTGPPCRGGRAGLRRRSDGQGVRHGDVRQHLHQHPGPRQRSRARAGRSRAGDATLRGAGRQDRRSRLHPRRTDLPSRRPAAGLFLRDVRHPPVADHRAPVAAARRGAHGRHAGDVRGGAGADGGVHRRVQRDRRPGHVGAARMDRRRSAHRHAFRRALRRRGHPVVIGRAARRGASVARSAAFRREAT